MANDPSLSGSGDEQKSTNRPAQPGWLRSALVLVVVLSAAVAFTLILKAGSEFTSQFIVALVVAVVVSLASALITRGVPSMPVAPSSAHFTEITQTADISQVSHIYSYEITQASTEDSRTGIRPSVIWVLIPIGVTLAFSVRYLDFILAVSIGVCVGTALSTILFAFESYRVWGEIPTPGRRVMIADAILIGGLGAVWIAIRSTDISGSTEWALLEDLRSGSRNLSTLAAEFGTKGVAYIGFTLLGILLSILAILMVASWNIYWAAALRYRSRLDQRMDSGVRNIRWSVSAKLVGNFTRIGYGHLVFLLVLLTIALVFASGWVPSFIESTRPNLPTVPTVVPTSSNVPAS